MEARTRADLPEPAVRLKPSAAKDIRTKSARASGHAFTARAYARRDARSNRPCAKIGSTTRRSEPTRILVQLVRQNPQFDPNRQSFGSWEMMLALLYNAKHERKLAERHQTEGEVDHVTIRVVAMLAKIVSALAGLAEAYAQQRFPPHVQVSDGCEWTNSQLRRQRGCHPR